MYMDVRLNLSMRQESASKKKKIKRKKEMIIRDNPLQMFLMVYLIFRDV